jgi:hypothetical protein
MKKMQKIIKVKDNGHRKEGEEKKLERRSSQKVAEEIRSEEERI